MTDSTRTVVIVQPYVPLYRVPLFDEMAEQLLEQDIHLRVVAPTPRGDQAARGDSAKGAAWHVGSASREVRARGVTFSYLGSRKAQQGADAVIAPAAATVADSHYALWRAKRSRVPVGLWGHIDSYVARPHPVDQAIESRMLRAADAVFAYTRTGAEKATAFGVTEERITCLDNTVALSGLERELDRLGDAEVREARGRLTRDGGRLLGYIGGLDADKRIGDLAAILDELYRLQPSTRMLVGGRGSDEGLLQSAVDRGQVIRFGYADDAIKSLIFRTSEAMLNPGRIGLLAVEAMAAGVPIVTSAGSFHGPEVDYLSEGTSLFTGPSNPVPMAHYLAGREFTRYSATPPRLQEMTKRFTAAILRMLSPTSSPTVG